ncbi:acyl-CoA Delta-9 desaturase-like isoform X1 [Artemia franciscana]|nr:stearoyl-CoA desaturase-like protein isoform 3 [Artemia franciscana]
MYSTIKDFVIQKRFNQHKLNEQVSADNTVTTCKRVEVEATDFLDKEEYEEDEKKLENEIVWVNVVIFSILHIAALYGGYLLLFSAKWQTLLFTYFLSVVGGVLGIAAGAHRLWSHRSYKAKLPLRILLMIANTLAWQNSLYEWARDHRVHHKFGETNADPHNSRRGFFFSHVGWLLVKKHPDVKAKGSMLDMSDLLADPVIRFQKQYYTPLAMIFCFILPTVVPAICWSESYWVAFFGPAIGRLVLTLNATWMINSFAHMWGNKPYDKYIAPTESKLVTFFTLGEGWHNYHHTFPQDYRSGELGGKRANLTTLLIDFFFLLGQVYDRKTVSDEHVLKRSKRTGDGSHARVK